MTSTTRIGLAIGSVLMLLGATLLIQNKTIRTLCALIVAVFSVIGLVFFTTELTSWLKTGQVVLPIWIDLGG